MSLFESGGLPKVAFEQPGMVRINEIIIKNMVKCFLLINIKISSLK